MGRKRYWIEPGTDRIRSRGKRRGGCLTSVITIALLAVSFLAVTYTVERTRAFADAVFSSRADTTPLAVREPVGDPRPPVCEVQNRRKNRAECARYRRAGELSPTPKRIALRITGGQTKWCMWRPEGSTPRAVSTIAFCMNGKRYES